MITFNMDFLLSRWIKLDENLTIIEYWLKRDKVVVKLFNKVKALTKEYKIAEAIKLMENKNGN